MTVATSSLDLSIGTDQLGVLTTTRRVVERSRYVHIDHVASPRSRPAWRGAIGRRPGTRAPLGRRDREAPPTWLLVLDALNFSFWGEPRWRVEYRGELLNGYTALAAALTRAVGEGVPLTDAELPRVDDARPTSTRCSPARARSRCSTAGSRTCTRSATCCCRSTTVRSAARPELRRLGACGWSADWSTELLSFDDVADHSGEEVRFYKRAQILAADLYGAFRGEVSGSSATWIS